MRGWVKAAIAIMMSFAAYGCASIYYRDLKPGQFAGSLFVLWLDEGAGQGRFLFVPDPNSRLTFTTSGERKRVIQPGLMYTDGGSIPRIAQVFKGFSPWGYAPAYMIHDWLFVARHCLIDGMDEARFKSVRDVSFDESAQILGEAIQALVQTGRVQQNDLAGATITGAVDSSIAQALWDQKGACAESIVTPEHAAIAERTIPGSSTFARSGEFSTRALPRATAGRKANIVSRITF